MSTKSKILALAVAAMFAATAFTLVADENSADDGTITYHIYLQLNDPTSDAEPVNTWLKPYECTEMSYDSFITALREGCQDLGLEVTTAMQTITSIGTFSDHGILGDNCYYFTFFYANEGDEEWKYTVSPSDEATTYAIVFDQILTMDAYNNLSDNDKKEYMVHESILVDYAFKKPNVGTTGYDSSMMYVIIAAIAILVIIAGTILYLRKKKTA